MMLTAQDVADKCNVDLSTVYAWCASGRLGHHRFGRIYRIGEDDLRAFLAASRGEPARSGSVARAQAAKVPRSDWKRRLAQADKTAKQLSRRGE